MVGTVSLDNKPKVPRVQMTYAGDTATGCGCASAIAVAVVTPISLWSGFGLLLPAITAVVLGLATYVHYLTNRASEKADQSWLIFEYRNAGGRVKDHMLADWSVSGDYLEGTEVNFGREGAIREGEFKTFRRDRIIRWIGGAPPEWDA